MSDEMTDANQWAHQKEGTVFAIPDSEQLVSTIGLDHAADILSAVRYARRFFNQDTDLGKALEMVFDAATRYAGSFEPVPGVLNSRREQM